MKAKTEAKGIGFGGKSLAEMLKESEDALQRTSKYQGIDKLTLKSEDPIKYEIFYSRLLNGTISARERARQMAASPVIREVAELCSSLMTPEGDSVAYSTGIVVHTQCMGRVIKWMIQNGYENDPGIRPGDIFECNDILMGGVHIPDVYTLIPVFYKEELVAWVGTVTHEPDVGAITAGCVPFMATDRFAEGIKLCAEKIGENDSVSRNYEIKARRSSRMADIWLIDNRARIAACFSVRESILKAIEEFGIDYYRQATKELIEEERGNQFERVKNRLIPGRYKEVSFLDILQADVPVVPWAQKDQLLAYPIEIDVDTSGKITLDAEGGSSWGYHSFNVPAGAMEGGLSIALNQILAYDGRVNSGFMFATALKLPQGLWCNPDTIFCATANAWNPLMLFLELLRKSLSMGFFARGFREEVMAGGGGISFVESGGKNQFGADYGGPIAEAAAGGGGLAIADGLDTGHVFWNTEADTGNAEVWELLYPYIYIGRNIIPDSGGYGRFRGGNSMADYLMVWGTKFTYMAEIPMNPHFNSLFNGGLFGGYPGLRFFDYIALNTDLKERIDKRLPIPHKDGDPKNPDIRRYLKGDIKLISHFHITNSLSEHDLIAHKVNSTCGGYGDPIERTPESVLSDLENMLTTEDTAKRIYGVAVRQADNREWQFDKRQTEQLRQEIRNDRKKKAVPVQQWWRGARDRIIAKKLDVHVIEMLEDCMSKSPRFTEEYKKFWALPDNFTFSGGE